MTPTTRSLSLEGSALEFSYALIVLMETFDKIDGWTIHVKRNDDATMRERHEKERERRGRDVGESLSSDQNPLSIASIGSTPTDYKLQYTRLLHHQHLQGTSFS